MRFEWDENKNKINIEKHGIDFNTAVRVFNDYFRIEIYDKLNSIFEDRYITIGEIDEKPFVVFVSYTERTDSIRIISAREATKPERRMYYDSSKRY